MIKLHGGTTMRIGIIISLILIITLSIPNVSCVGIVASDNLQYSNDTEYFNYFGLDGYGYSYHPTFNVLTNLRLNGTIRLKYDAKFVDSVYCTPICRAYSNERINSVAVGTERTLTTTYTTYSEDISVSIDNASNIGVWLRNFDYDVGTYSKNSRVYFTISNNISTTPNISYPINNSRQYNNSVNHIWNQSIDNDGDTISYDFWLSNQSNFSNTVNRTNITVQLPIISQDTSDVNNVNQFGQTFNTTSSQTNISKISIWMDNSGYTQTWYNISVWDSPAKTTYIGSKNMSFLTTSYQWVDFSFDTILTASPNTQYYFDAIKGSDGSYGHSYTTGDSYNGGDYYRNSIMVYGSDIKFRIYDSNIRITNIVTTDGVTYYSRVRSFDEYEYSNWSNTIQFTENTAPSTPVTIQESDFHALNLISINWTNSTDAQGDNLLYDLKVWNTTTNTLALDNTGITNTTSNTFILANFTDYNYSVRAYDGYEYSPWSTNKTFGFTNVAPTYTNIVLSPATPTITDNLTISYTVSDSEGDLITNYTRWYKDSVLQTSLNNTLYVNATGNTSFGQTWRYEIFGNDTYENSTPASSNEVIIGSTNSPPSFTSIVLTPNNKKYNKTINVNASGITDDNTTWQVQTYYLIDTTKVYLANSSWINTSYSNLTITIPWSDGGLHTIYALVYDSGNATGVENLTSAPLSASFTSNITSPIVNTSSLSTTAITTGGSVIISSQINGLGANITSVKALVRRPDATSANWTMNCGSGELVNCTYTYDSTSDVGNYYIDYFYALDNSGNLGSIASSLTFLASAPTPTTPPSSGGGGTTYPTPTPKVNDSLEDVVLKIKGINPELPSGLAELIAECYTKDLLLEGKCSTIDLSSPMNFWPIILGAFIGSAFTIFGIAIITKKPRKLLVDTFLYGTVTIVIIQIAIIAGLNFYYLNYLFQSDLPGFMFASTISWSVIISYAGDSIYNKKKGKSKNF